MAVALREGTVFLSMNDTLTSGITKVDPTLPIVNSYTEYAVGAHHHSVVITNALKKAIAADAALGFGEWIASFPLGRIRPSGAFVKLTSTTATGLSATAGEVGLGTTIASGAVATLGGTVAFGDIMDGTTLSNHVAATPLVSKKGNAPDLTGTLPTDGQVVLDGSATAKKIHLNLASTWDQTAAESVTFSAECHIYWNYFSAGL